MFVLINKLKKSMILGAPNILERPFIFKKDATRGIADILAGMR
jgi:hypothetical protein